MRCNKESEETEDETVDEEESGGLPGPGYVPDPGRLWREGGRDARGGVRQRPGGGLEGTHRHGHGEADERLCSCGGAKRFGTTYIADDVSSIEACESDSVKPTYRVTLSDDSQLEASSLIIATGSSFRKLGVPGEQELSGHGVSYCATCDGFFFRNKPIVVVGGGDSAFEEALFLTRFGSSVTLIHRRDSFRASQIMVDRAKANPTITLMTNTVVTSITGTSSPTQNTGAPIAIPGLTLKRPAVAPASVSSIAVRNVVTGEESTLDTNAVFVAIGHTPATDFAAGVVDRDDDGYVVVQGASTVTSAPGIFAAGDCVDHTYRQAISAAGMGCRAALDTQAYLTD